MGRHVFDDKLLALISGLAVALSVETARALEFGVIFVVITAVATAAGVTWLAIRVQRNLFLGPHGIWALTRAAEFMRQRPLSGGRSRAAGEDRLAKVNPK